MKKLIASITIFGLLFSPTLRAQEDYDAPDEPDFIYEDDDFAFNRGCTVGKESDEYLRAMRRVRNTNWAIAFGTTTLGIITLVLVGFNHNNK